MRRIWAMAVAGALLAGCSASPSPDPGVPAPATQHVAARHHRASSTTQHRHPNGTSRPTVTVHQKHRKQHEDRQHRTHAKRHHHNRCAHNTVAQRAIVSVARQHMWMCARHRTVYSTPVTTGIVGQYTSTPTGDYWIQGRTRDTSLTLITGQTYAVRYWIPFDAPLFGFHDSSWQHFRYGSPQYRTEGSHGCVHMPLRAIAWFYRWVARPTAVHIS